MADLRTARRTAEQLARDALGGTLLGAAGELGVAQARRAEAAGTIAAAAENARGIVRAAEAEAAAVVDRPSGGHRGRHRLRRRLADGHWCPDRSARVMAVR